MRSLHPPPPPLIHSPTFFSPTISPPSLSTHVALQGMALLSNHADYCLQPSLKYCPKADSTKIYRGEFFHPVPVATAENRGIRGNVSLAELSSKENATQILAERFA